MRHAGDDSLTLNLPDESATLALGARLSGCLRPGMTVWLSGDLGAGKTTLTRGLLRALGHAGRVKSPTYTLVEIYPLSSFNLYHFDLYRFADPEEWELSGFRDYFNPESVGLVEWPEKAGAAVPSPDLEIRLEVMDVGRTAQVHGRTKEGMRCVASLSESCSA
ncbi:MAG: tRNA (adenosine(37)-N6)-threonylcarbamoyltransferase complex ATPase subunit type 1 TsaE [Pseudomonadota bacterium]